MIAVTELSTSNLLILLERFVPGSMQQQLADPSVTPAGLLANGRTRGDKGASAAAAATDHHTPTAFDDHMSATLDSLDVSAGDMGVCAGAWSTHMVVFSTPWEDSSVEVLAVYRCKESLGALSHDIPAIARFVPKNAKVVAYSSPLLLGKVVLFDYRTATATNSVCIPQQVCSMSFAPDAQMLALGGVGHSVFLALDLGAKEEPLELKGHRCPVGAVAFVDSPARGTAAAPPCLVSSGGQVLLVWSLHAALERRQAMAPKDSKIM